MEVGDAVTVIKSKLELSVLKDWKCPLEEIPVGKGRKLKDGKDMAVVTLGPIGNIAAKAIERAEKEKNISIAHNVAYVGIIFLSGYLAYIRYIFAGSGEINDVMQFDYIVTARNKCFVAAFDGYHVIGFVRFGKLV